MKCIRLLILILALSGITGCISFQPMRYSGTVNLTDSLRIDQTEINVHAWLSYYTWKLQNEGPVAAGKVLPDSSAVDRVVLDYIMTKSSEFSNCLSIYTKQPLGYFQSSCAEAAKSNKNLAFAGSSSCPILYFPITGVTYEQVVEFCAWRTKIVGEGKVEYRLPTEKEWAAVAARGYSEAERSHGYRDSLLYKGKLCQMYNYKVTTPCEHRVKQGSTVATLDIAGSYMPDKVGVYELFGNVSEMTLTKGVSKGGNYTLYASQCHPDSTQTYSKPEVWLGFRCVAVKVK